METYLAELFLYLTPDKRLFRACVELPISAKQNYEDMTKHNYRIIVNPLKTGQTSVKISHPNQEVDVEIVASKTEIESAIIKMLNRRQWQVEYGN